MQAITAFIHHPIRRLFMRRYCWIPGLSITGLEVLVGAVWDNNPNAIFMMRDNSILSDAKRLPGVDHATLEKVLGYYYEQHGSEPAMSLTALKQMIHACVHPDQICKYSCQVTGLKKDSGRLILSGLGKPFGDNVFDFLSKAIQRQYGYVTKEPQTETEIQNDEQLWFVEDRSARLLGREAEMLIAINYIEEELNDSKRVCPSLV